MSLSKYAGRSRRVKNFEPDLADQAVLAKPDDELPIRIDPERLFEVQARDEIGEICASCEATESEAQMIREAYLLGLNRGVTYGGDRCIAERTVSRLAVEVALKKIIRRGL